jgi:hypothetical protein
MPGVLLCGRVTRRQTRTWHYNRKLNNRCAFDEKQAFTGEKNQPTRVASLAVVVRSSNSRSVGALALPRLERQRLGRMPVLADAGNAHAAREIAIGKAHPRAAEAALVELLETETRLE